MSQVISGLVSIEDGIKKAEEYAPPRKVRVELSFGVGEGEDYQAIFDTVSQAATNRVHALLHGTALASVQAAPAAAAPSAPATDPAAVGDEVAAEAPKRTRRTKEQIAADNAAAAANKADPASVEDPTGGQAPVIHLPDASVPANTPANAPAATAADPAAIEDDLTSSPATAAADPAAIGDDLTTAPAAEVSDAELNSAVQKKNGDINNPPAIRALIGTFNPDPTKVFQLAQIPQAQRPDFLAKLAALKAAAA